MGQWQERKKKGLCTRCGVQQATGLRKLLCDPCKSIIARHNAQYEPKDDKSAVEPTKYYEGG